MLYPFNDADESGLFYHVQKLATYGFDKNILCYIYSYLKSRKQWACVNNIKSTFKEIISQVPQESVVGPIPSNIFLNSFPISYQFLRLIILQITILFQVLLKKIENLIIILESQNVRAITWFKDNHTIVNPGILQGIILNKHKRNHTKGWVIYQFSYAMRHIYARVWRGVITNDALKFRKLSNLKIDVLNFLLLYLSNHRWKQVIYQLRKYLNIYLKSINQWLKLWTCAPMLSVRLLLQPTRRGELFELFKRKANKIRNIQ